MGTYGTAQPKPSRLDRDVKKFERHLARAKEKARVSRQDAKAWHALWTAVRARDKNACRVGGKQTTKFGAGDPKLWGQGHHIRYRSAGGADTMDNLIWICYPCHSAEHEHRIQITGTADALTVTRC